MCSSCWCYDVRIAVWPAQRPFKQVATIGCIICCSFTLCTSLIWRYWPVAIDWCKRPLTQSRVAAAMLSQSSSQTPVHLLWQNKTCCKSQNSCQLFCSFCWCFVCQPTRTTLKLGNQICLLLTQKSFQGIFARPHLNGFVAHFYPFYLCCPHELKLLD